jgi:CRISPR/Cas system CSM-associated protein Csm3 (group 7 of RAMP superfamily)
MRNKITMKLIPDSSFLLGGVSVNPAYDAVTALLDNNLPYLTATAIKGALRMDFEAFIRGIGETDICELEKNDFRGCGDCLLCQLFGGNNNEGKLRFNSAFLEDADNVLPEDVRDDILEKGKREGVSISRALGKSKEKSYYSTLTFPDMKDVRDISFKTHIDINQKLKEKEIGYLEAFFAFLNKTGLFMGSKKSVGLGNFKISCSVPEKFDQAEKVDTSDKELKLFLVTLKTLEPLVVGDLKNQYIINTLPYIPASTMGGSIGFGFLKNGIDDDVVTNLFHKNNSFSPFNFYLNHPFPNPTSMRAKKGEKEIEKDILLSDFIIKKAIKDGKFNAVKSLFDILYRSNLRPVPICEKPETTYHTKVAIGRILQKTKEGMLYSMELIPKESQFQGLVIGEAWTREALIEMNELFIGGKRTRGFGRTKIENVEPMVMDELLNREVSIDAELRNIAKDFSIGIDEGCRYFTLDVLSDLVVPPEKTIKWFFEEKIFSGMDIKIEKSYPDIIWRGGYDFKEKKEKPLIQKIGAGSTFLVSVPDEKEKTFTDKVENMMKDSIQYKWDSTPLFMLNNPKHKDIWR